MKKLTGFLAVVLTASTLSYSTPSKAAVGVIMVNPGVILGGLAMVTVGGGTLVLGQSLGDIAGVGGLMAFLGMIVLDGEDGQAIAFNQLSPQAATKLGVTESERSSFNAEIDQVNFIFDEVGAELKQMRKPTAKDARKIWASYENLVSAETFSTMKKISTKSLKK